MIDPLDLHLTLTPPPASAAENVIASLEVRCDALGLAPARGVLTDPLHPGEREQLRWYLEEYWKWPFEQFKERARGIERLLGEIGQRFNQQLSFNINADRILQAWSATETNQRQISIFSEVPAAYTLPWELLHDEQGFLALRNRPPVSIIRKLPQYQLPRITTFKPPLRILLVTARPQGASLIDPRADAHALLDAMQAQIEAGAIEVEFLRPPTLPALRKRLGDMSRPSIHILHFDGHGIFGNDETPPSEDERVRGVPGQGFLAFEDDEGHLAPVSADDLAHVLQDSHVPLAVLNACQSAQSIADDAFSSVAGRLIKGGLDAVIAMSASVLVAGATRYVNAFYGELAEGTSVPLAHERARQALHADPRRHLQERQADREPQPVKLSDWWVPHFYQQRALTLKPTGRRSARKLPITLSGLPDEPRYGFSGRARELFQIERWLWQRRLVVIHGFGGIGKTALAREAADWLTRTGMYRRACFVSFEQGGDASTLLSALGHFLGVYDSHYNPQDYQAALAKLALALEQQPTLIIADNLESLLLGGDTPLHRKERIALWDTLLGLARLRAGVLLTCRDPNVGDARLAQGKDVAHLALEGLHPDDAYLLASSLLNDLILDRARAPYRVLRDLLKALDHHPLAIQLVLPALGQYSLETIRHHLAELLPQFADEKETGRNRSLLASLQYSLNRLSSEQRALLPRLALFEGGANEDSLLEITEIPEYVWSSLGPALEQAALLTAEQVHEDIPFFLRFHPVLTPFLRGQPGADDPALRERFVQDYADLAGYLSYEDDSNPLPVRALALREMPNLRRALDLSLEQGQLDVATRLADNIIQFLNHFGWLRQRDEVRQCVERAFEQHDVSLGEALTYEAYLHLSGLGEDEYRRGAIKAAHDRFSALLARIEALPEGAPLGPGSYEHRVTLGWMARSLRASGQPDAAEAHIRKALTIIEELLKQELEDQDHIHNRGTALTDLGDILRDQGRYPQARAAYEEALHIDMEQENLPGQVVLLGQLGSLEFIERHFDEARKHFTKARDLSQALGQSPATEWHNLGIVAEEQQDWPEAERCYRESLALKEKQGDWAGAADTWNDLGNIADDAGRPAEAEGWYKRALDLDKQKRPGSVEHASHLANLAGLLVKEVRAGHAGRERLAEARSYAERARAIKEQLDTSVEIWQDLHILANIAEMEGRTEVAQAYRSRERKTFADFEGNHYLTDLFHKTSIAFIVAAARGKFYALLGAEIIMPTLRVKGWPVAAIQRILQGERDWDNLAMTRGLGGQGAFIIQKILERLAQPPAENQEQLDNELFEQLLAAPEGHAQAGEGAEEDAEARGKRQEIDGFVSGVAAAAEGNQGLGVWIEMSLPMYEAKMGWRITGAVQRILRGERDAAALVAGLDTPDKQLIRRILALLAE